MYLTTSILQSYLSKSLALRTLDWLNVSLQYPCVVWRDLLVVVLVQTDFLEAVTFIETFRVTVRHLYVKVDRGDFGLCVCNGRVDEMLKALRPNAPGPIWLRERKRKGARWASA